MSILRLPANTAGRDFITGDVHGCFSRLQALLDRAGFDPEKDRLFCTGDLVDRGPESLDAMEWLDRPWFHSVLGNHEQMAINFAAGHNHAFLYERNGGRWFINLSNEEQFRIAQRFKELPLAIEVEVAGLQIGIVHAEVPDDDWRNLETPGKWGREIALWARDRIEAERTNRVENIDCVFVGHTPVGPTTAFLGNVAYIDTGAVFGCPMVLHQLGGSDQRWEDKP